MRHRSILTITTLFVLGFGIAGFASGGPTGVFPTVSCCCCSGDSCPMKKDAAGKSVAAGHENCDCCIGDGASCPMMKKGDNAAAGEHACCCCGGDGESCPMMKKGENVSADMKTGEGPSCPMMKKGDGDADAGMMHEHHMKMADGSACSCPCCQHDNMEKTQAAPAA